MNSSTRLHKTGFRIITNEVATDAIIAIRGGENILGRCRLSSDFASDTIGFSSSLPCAESGDVRR